MAFDDLAKRMRETHGSKVGDVSQTTDPEQIIANAMKAERRANILSDFVLGPILLVGGIIVAVLGFQVNARGGSVGYLRGAAVVAIITGLAKIGRGFARLVRR